MTTFSEKIIAPRMEKLIADGAINSYLPTTKAIHTRAPGTFTVVYTAAKAEGLDKVLAALMAAQADPMQSAAFNSIVDWWEHRDSLLRANSTFK